MFTAGVLCLLLCLGSVAGDTLVPPKFDQPPVIDGRLIEDIWKDALVAKGNFCQVMPSLGEGGSESTYVYLGYDDKNLYCGFVCFMKDTSTVKMSVCSRDEIWNQDMVGIALDPLNATQEMYILGSNACGCIGDSRKMRGGHDDLSWDADFKCSAVRDSLGYVVEMAIPFESFRHSGKDIQVWGVNFVRFVSQKGEWLSWRKLTKVSEG